MMKFCRRCQKTKNLSEFFKNRRASDGLLTPCKDCLAADWNDLVTHRQAWRDALIIARRNAERADPDGPDGSYWQHELKAFDRIFALLEDLPDLRTQIAELQAKLAEARDHVRALAVAEDIEDIGPVIAAAQSWLTASGATIKLPEPTPDQIEYLRSVTNQTAYDPETVIGTASSTTGGKDE